MTLGSQGALARLGIEGAAASPGSSTFYVARQSIFDREQHVHGYELLFRGWRADGSAVGVDGNAATAQLITHGVLVGGSAALSGGRPLFMNFTRDLLVNGGAMLLSPKVFVIEVLESVTPDLQVLGACHSLRGEGYRVALDDVIDVDRIHAFADVATLVKVDLACATEADVSRIVVEARHRGLETLAEKIETPEQYRFALDQGFDFLQGYYFSKPEAIARPTMMGIAPAHLQLLRVVSRRDLDVDAVARAVEADPSLTYKLLRTANSAASGQFRQLSSMREVVVFFGQEEIRRAATMVVLGAITGGPEHLLVTSLVRARFCEGIATRLGSPEAPPFHCYLAGLLSTIDRMLDCSMEEALERLPLPPEVGDALVSGTGLAANALTLVRAYEEADWDTVRSLAGALGLSETEIPTLYIAALDGADAAVADAA